MTLLANDEIPYLNALKALLAERANDKLYACIRDLLENGLDVTRFQPGEFPPNRQDVTQYLAAWSRYAGLTEDQSRSWLIDYCISKLGVLSRRTPAAIRHSTKGNLQYIYRSEVAFICGCAKNRLRAQCTIACPVYAEMEAASRAKEEERPKPLPPAPVIPLRVPVKLANQEQFQTALRLVREEINKGARPRHILQLLEERGLKTRTGRKWTSSILSSEIANLKRATDEPGL